MSGDGREALLRALNGSLSTEEVNILLWRREALEAFERRVGDGAGTERCKLGERTGDCVRDQHGEDGEPELGLRPCHHEFGNGLLAVERAAEIALRRLGQPSEVADVIWFLCSDQASYVTGTEIEVNAGQHV